VLKFGDENGEDIYNKPEFFTNNQVALIKKRVPTASYLDAKESEQ
jgi:hypothetical protein